MGTVHEPTAMAVHLKVKARGNELSIGTGFHVGHSGEFFLVTAGHNLTGRNYETGEPLSANAATPDSLSVRHTWVSTLGQWTEVKMPLFDADGNAKWLEHPIGGAKVDVVALPVEDDHPGHATIYAWNLDGPILAELAVPDDVSIIGYPFGRQGGGGFAVWSRGTIATELDFDHDGLPMFLIDSRTRPGQSGSPVCWYSSHGLIPVKGGWRLNDGKNPPMTLMGVYSGRIDAQSDLGRVFTMSAIRDVLTGGKRASTTWVA
jgi:V8-like Glu-specific endopeptidase